MPQASTTSGTQPGSHRGRGSDLATRGKDPARIAAPVARAFEAAIWQARLVVLVAVVGSLLLALGVLYAATVDVINLVGRLGSYADPGLSPEARAALRGDVLTGVVGAVDGYLIASITLVFALGLYELFVSKLEVAAGSESGGSLLLIRSLDDLKDRLAKLVLLTLVIEFFKLLLSIEPKGPLDLLYLGAGIGLVAGAAYLSSRSGSGH